MWILILIALILLIIYTSSKSGDYDRRSKSEGLELMELVTASAPERRREVVRGDLTAYDVRRLRSILSNDSIPTEDLRELIDRVYIPGATDACRESMESVVPKERRYVTMALVQDARNLLKEYN